MNPSKTMFNLHIELSNDQRLSVAVDAVKTLLAGLRRCCLVTRVSVDQAGIGQAFAEQLGDGVIAIPPSLAAQCRTRDARVLAAFNGSNIAELAEQFQLTQNAIYKIIHRARLERPAAEPEDAPLGVEQMRRYLDQQVQTQSQRLPEAIRVLEALDRLRSKGWTITPPPRPQRPDARPQSPAAASAARPADAAGVQTPTADPHCSPALLERVAGWFSTVLGRARPVRAASGRAS